MERILSDNDKLRKAEEIYYRRNHRQAIIQETKEQKMPKKQKTYFGSRILLEVLILVIIAIIIFAVKNKDYIFSQAFLDNVSNYNINLTEKFSFITKYFKSEEKTENEDVFINNETEQITQNNENAVEQNPVVEKNEEVPTEVEQAKPVETTGYIRPISGIITSRFGKRTSGTHTGIDLAADLGTNIQASMSGVVTQVSNQGDYGNHVRISKDNVTTLYAHCNEVLVTEGQEVGQGQIIATVGSTGNSTGPHLHFEIIIDGNQINPTDIVDF